MPDANPSQGTTVSFQGAPLTHLLSVRASPGSARSFDAILADASMAGSGDTTRIKRLRTVTTIDSGSVSISLLGSPPYGDDDIGDKGSLSITTPGGSVSGEAFLESCEVEAQVGDLIRSTVVFQFTGE